MNITFDPALVIQLVVSSILPLLVGLVTKLDAKSWQRAVLLAVLTLVSTLGTELLRSVQDGVTYDLGRGLILALPAFITSVGMYFGLWKATGLPEKLQAVGSGSVNHSQGD